MTSPLAGDPMDNPDHSVFHRIFDIDITAPEQSAILNSTGQVGIGGTPSLLLHVMGTSEVEFGIEASAGNPDLAFIEAGDNKAQIKYDITGHGMAFHVEESHTGYGGITNVKMFVGDDGNVGIATIIPSVGLEVLSAATTARGITSSQYNDGINSAQIHFRKARGTEASPTAVLANDAIGSLRFDGYNGTVFSDGAAIVVVANENWTGSAEGTNMQFYTTADGSTSRAERMRIADDGRVIIGGITPTVEFEVIATGTVDRGIKSSQYSDNTNAAQVHLQKARGTEASPTALLSGDGLGNLHFDGHNGTVFSDGAAIIVRATENWSASAEGSEMQFFTTPDGTTARLERMVIDQDGTVKIGTGTVSAQLHVDQASATGAMPSLLLDQADVSEEMIEFVSTIGTGNAIEAIAAKTLTTTHFIKVTIPGGLTRYLPVGTIA